jgi:hypothetical protein
LDQQRTQLRNWRDLQFQEPENYLMVMFMCVGGFCFLERKNREELGDLFNADSSAGRYKWNESTDFLSAVWILTHAFIPGRYMKRRF